MLVIRRLGLVILLILFVKILLIRVVVCEVSFVGFVINRINDLENIIFKNLFVVVWE